MSESLKPRFAVDYNEIERQLAQTQAASAQSAAASRNDPLAELARIVGQDDPFQSLLANDGSVRPRQRSSSAEVFAARDAAAPAARAQQGRHEEPRFDHAHEPQGQAAYGGQEAYGGTDYAQEYYDEGEAHHAASPYGQAEQPSYQPMESRRSRKGMVAVGTILAAAVVGLGGAYVFTGGSSASGGDGAPPLVMATSAPTKVQPQNPGGVEIPNQNKQIYERAIQSPETKTVKDTKIVNREEQPVDVKQAVRMNGAVADATGATASASAPPAQAQQPPAGLNLGEPRKVRTLAIRPDGTLINPEPANARPAPVPLPAMTLPAEARGAPAQAAPVQVASAQAVPVAQPRPAPSTPVAAPATPAPSRPVPAASTPTSGSSPQNVASAQPVAPAPAAATEAVVGGYAVQLGLANSESAAGATLAQFQRKYPDLNGKPSMIRKAEVNGNTIYRVRVGPLSKEEASSLCSKLQGQGGQCFVAKN